MSPVSDAAAAPSPAQAEWAQFERALGEQLAALWPAMPQKLGDRYASFIELGVQHATRLGLQRAAPVARYVNLWFVWGSGFQDRPGFEWAAGLLAAPRAREWNTVHQLVARSLQELQRLPDVQIPAAALQAADLRLLDTFGHLGSRGQLHPSEPLPAPRAACDLQALELRLLERSVAQCYELVGGQWQPVALPEPAPLRVHAAQPLPPLLAVLSHAQGAGPLTRMQARLSAVSVCSADVHPELRVSGSHGLWRWRGHEAGACNWPLATLSQVGPAAGPGTAVAEETSPDILHLDISTCGLRDEGDPLGLLHTQLWVWPAAQWWLDIQRQAAVAQPLLAAQPPALRAQTRCRVEEDFVAQDAGPLTDGFTSGLDAATAAALQALQQAWQCVPGMVAGQGDGLLALLVGRASLSWGWQLGACGMDGRALMRLVGELQMQAVQADWQLEGELTQAGARARLLLRCQGRAPLAAVVRRQAAEPPLLALLPQLQVRFRLPLQAELTPLAGDTAALLQSGGAVTGALVGEAGLRPRSRGGSGFEWFASLRLEAVQLPLLVLDPLLGSQTLLLPLLPAQTLLDWSLG